MRITAPDKRGLCSDDHDRLLFAIIIFALFLLSFLSLDPLAITFLHRRHSHPRFLWKTFYPPTIRSPDTCLQFNYIDLLSTFFSCLLEGLPLVLRSSLPPFLFCLVFRVFWLGRYIILKFCYLEDSNSSNNKRLLRKFQLFANLFGGKRKRRTVSEISALLKSTQFPIV